MVTYTLKVVEIKTETEDTITLCFKQPALKKINYIAGQYLTLIFRINGRRYIRPYSFSSTPVIDPLIEVTIKRVPNGIVSNYIHDFVNEGDSIEVMQPMGEFIYNPQKSPDQVFLWGIGSGITPLISIIKQLLIMESTCKVILVYGNRNHENTIFLSLISDLLERYSDRFKTWNFHTQFLVNEEIPCLVQGRINKDKALSILQNVDLTNTLHYICGPVGLKESIKEALYCLDVNESDILSEDFELFKDPKDYENIHTQNIELIFEDQKHILEVIKGKSVLESALDAGIEVPYSCQTGSCSTCKGIVRSGSLKMIGLSKEREDLLSNEYLLCCSHPISDDVCVEI